MKSTLNINTHSPTYIIEIGDKKSQIYKYDDVIGVKQLDNMLVLIRESLISSYYDLDQIQSFTYKEKSNE